MHPPQRDRPVIYAAAARAEGGETDPVSGNGANQW
jgi:hypothetical protein